VDNDESGASGRRRHGGGAGGSRGRRWSRKRTWQLAAVVALLIAAAVVYGRAALTARAGRFGLTMAVPAYVFPGQPALVSLQRLSPPPGMVILNPDNGDGPFSAQWQAQADRLRARGTAVLGYVHTDGATRPLAAAESSISNYFQSASGGLPHVSGIFLDEMSSGCAAEPYYAALYAYIRSIDPLAIVMANPGAPVNACFLRASSPVANVFVTFEHDVSTYLSQYQGNVEAASGAITSGGQYPASDFCHLIYGASRAQLQQVLRLAVARHAGCAYVTDAELPNPWDSVASYLPAEARAMAAVPGTGGSR
jgi:Spherulation-specific family 4